MCLILLAWQAHPDYPLVVAANRDEFHARRTAAADFWQDAPAVLAGRDLEAGGTWLGVSRGGRFAALTNFRDPERNKPDAPSRGKLVSRFLAGTQSPQEYLDQIETSAATYNGFNLLFGDRHSLWCFSNCGEGKRQLDPGIYGLSNHLLDTPWPKVTRARSQLAQALTAMPQTEPLFAMLRDEAIAPDAHLPRTGVSLEWERLLSAAFVRSPDYGTRCSTVVTVGADGEVRFEERSFGPGARPAGTARLRFTLGEASGAS